MNQRQALTEASRYVGVYRWGNGFKVYYPWKDSDRRGARTETQRHYWASAQQCAALRKAELALWILCDDSDRMPDNWREWYDDACQEMRMKQEYPGGLTARDMVKIGVDVILNMCEKYPAMGEVQE